MKLYLLMFCLLMAPAGFAQKQNNNWAITSNTGFLINFNTVPPSVITAASATLQEYPTAVSDSLGNLLFYPGAGYAWDKNNQVMPNGNFVVNASQQNGYNGTDNQVIIPDPGNSKRYYMIGFFTAVIGDAYNHYYYHYYAVYSIIDMSLNNGLGDVVPGYKNIRLDSNLVTGVGIGVGNGICDKWLILKKEGSDEYLTYKITAAGFNTTAVVSHTSNLYGYELKISNNNLKLACIEGAGLVPNNFRLLQYPMRLCNYDFNPVTGSISNEVTIDTIGNNDPYRFNGMEFSQDNSKFYYVKNITWNPGIPHTNNLYQQDLSLPTLADIHNSKTLLASYGNPGISTFDPVRVEDKIYVLLDSSNYYVVQHPDLPGLACGLDSAIFAGYNYTSFQTNTPHVTVPVTNVIHSFHDFNTCSFPFTLKSQADPADSYTWSTGATTKSINISGNGIYWVKAAQVCGSFRIDTFRVNFAIPAPIHDTAACAGKAIQLQLDPANTYNWLTPLPAGGIRESGTYRVIISKGLCKLTDTFKVLIYPAAGSKILPADTVFCNGNPVDTISSLYLLGNFRWSTGATTSSIPVSTPGTYWLHSVTPCGPYDDTIHIAYCNPTIDSILSPGLICAGTCINVTAAVRNFPDHYQWSFTGAQPDTASGAAPPPVCYNVAGNYVITLAVTGAGGTSTSSKAIVVLDKPVSPFKDSVVAVTYKAPLLLAGCAGAAQISWYKDGKLVCDNCASVVADSKYFKTLYHCIIRNGDCTDTCDYQVLVSDIPTDAWMPTAFSPNGDGKNDYFHLITDNPNIYITRLNIYNRYGQRVYNQPQNDRGWDGTIGGIPCEIGVYFWQLRYKVQGSNEEHEQKGDVTLVR